MKLFGTPISPFVRKLRAYMDHCGLEAELVPVGLGDPNPEYGKASPFRKMPALLDGDFGISDSSAIVTYLEAKYGPSGLMGDTPEEKARIHWFDEFADTMLVPAGGGVFFNRVLMPVVVGQPGDDKAAADSAAKLPALFAYLEGELAGRAYLVGDRLTFADLAVASAFASISVAREAPDPAKYPALTAWVAKLESGSPLASCTAHFHKVMARFTQK